MSYDPDRLDDYAFEAEIAQLRRQFLAFEGIELALLAEHVPPRGSFLDLGCGPGLVTAQVKTTYPDLEVHGIDYSQRMISLAREQHGQIRWAIGDAHDLPYGPRLFDFVYARFVFQHLEHPLQAASSVARVLRPGGKLVIVDGGGSRLVVPGAPSALETLQERFARLKEARGADRNIGTRLRSIIEDAGFVVETTPRSFTAEGQEAVRRLLQLTLFFRAEAIEGGSSCRDEILAWLEGEHSSTPRAELVVPIYVATLREH